MSADLKQMVAAAQQGDAGAFEAIYSTTYNKVYYLALKTLKDEQDALDVVQDTFIEVFSHIKDLRDSSAFRGWLGKITINNCNKIIKKKNAGKITLLDEDMLDMFESVPDDDEEFAPHKKFEREELREAVMAIIDQLPTVHREAITLKYYFDYSEKEIAEALDCPVGTVKSRLSNAKKKIKEEIKKREKQFKTLLGLIPLLFRKNKTTSGGQAASAGVSAAVTQVLVAVAAVAVVSVSVASYMVVSSQNNFDDPTNSSDVSFMSQFIDDFVSMFKHDGIPENRADTRDESVTEKINDPDSIHVDQTVPVAEQTADQLPVGDSPKNVTKQDGDSVAVVTTIADEQTNADDAKTDAYEVTRGGDCGVTSPQFVTTRAPLTTPIAETTKPGCATSSPAKTTAVATTGASSTAIDTTDTTMTTSTTTALTTNTTDESTYTATDTSTVPTTSAIAETTSERTYHSTSTTTTTITTTTTTTRPHSGTWTEQKGDAIYLYDDEVGVSFLLPDGWRYDKGLFDGKSLELIPPADIKSSMMPNSRIFVSYGTGSFLPLKSNKLDYMESNLGISAALYKLDNDDYMAVESDLNIQSYGITATDKHKVSLSTQDMTLYKPSYSWPWSMLFGKRYAWGGLYAESIMQIEIPSYSGNLVFNIITAVDSESKNISGESSSICEFVMNRILDNELENIHKNRKEVTY